MSIDIRMLRHFILLADELHFGRAAERLGIAQSLLSGQVRRIEDVLGGRLLNRGRRAAVSLTPAGLTYLHEAREAVERLDRAERVGRLAIRGAAGSARLGYVFSAAMNGVLTSVLTLIRERFPLIDLSVAPLDTPAQFSALAEARLDIGLGRPIDVVPNGVSTRLIHSEPMLLALSASHSLSNAGAIHPADLWRETFLVPHIRRSVSTMTAVAELARIGDFEMPAISDCRDFLTAVSLAASGNGVVLVPASLSNLRVPGVVYREIADYPGVMELVMAWRGDPSPLVQNLFTALTKEVF